MYAPTTTLYDDAPITQIAIRAEHQPNAYDFSKELRKALEGVSPQVVEANVISFLGERVGLPITRPYAMHMQGGKLYSLDFPNEPLEVLYGKDLEDPVYNYRAQAEVDEVQTLQTWMMLRQDNFSWVMISPTTGSMSNVTMVEIGQRLGPNYAMATRLTIPHREDQTVEQALDEMKKLASFFNGELLNAQSELDLIRNPVITRREAGQRWEQYASAGIMTPQKMVEAIDRIMYEISGVRYFIGRPEHLAIKEMLGDPEADTKLFGEIIDRLSEEGDIQNYIDRVFQFAAPPVLKGEFNNIVNKFDYMWQNRYHMRVKEMNIDGKWTHNPKKVSGACGTYGEDEDDTEHKALEAAVPQDGKGPRWVKCKHCRQYSLRPFGGNRAFCGNCFILLERCG